MCLKVKSNNNNHNLLFCIIEATPDSHVAWLWYSERYREGKKHCWLAPEEQHAVYTSYFEILQHFFYSFFFSKKLIGKKVSHIDRFFFSGVSLTLS